MIQLSDYFQPLNPHTLFYSFLLFVFFDSLGTFVKKFIIKPVASDSSRILNWLIGFGFFIFVWFVLRFFIPPHQPAVIITILVLSAVALPTYVKNGEFKKALAALWQLKIPLLIIAFFLPAVFVKASLPPYYADEMAYQFIPPYFLKMIDVWRFDGGLYSNVPQLFNTFFNLAFALTKTYSIVRLFHFSILVTAMGYTYQKLKDHFGLIIGFFFVFTFFSLPIDIVLTATLGYVDVATYSFILIGVVSLLDFLFVQTAKPLLLAAIFWGMALGTKYTATTIFITYNLSVLLVVWTKQKFLLPKIINRRTVFSLISVVLIFGGYWYIKNLIAYGNPIYPFFLPCLRYAEFCKTQAANFFAWTTPITMANIPRIIKALLPANTPLQIALLTAPILAFLNKNPKTRLLSVIFTLTISLEFLILKQFSGFYPRYQQHLQLLMLLLIAIQLANQYSSVFINFIAKIFYLLVFYFVLASFVLTVINTNSLKVLNWTEINYARGKIDIYDWVDQKFPRVKDGITWCEKPPSGRPTPLARFDPDMIWYEDDGFMRSFMTNCYFENPPLEDLPLDQVLDTAVKGKMQFWTITPNRCQPQEEVQKHLSYEGDHQLYLRRLNNIVVCHSQEVRPNLYYFDYAAL